MARFQNGNPGGPGRPKGPTQNTLVKKWAEEIGMPLLLKIAEGKDRGWGKLIVLMRLNLLLHMVWENHNKPLNSQM